MQRCGWCLINEPMVRYHDEEWGVPLYDDQKQFEFLCLEVLQCGLNWNMMIQKRAIFRRCFADFDPAAVAAFDETEIARILATEGMIRSRRKVEAIIHNARCFAALQKECGSFSDWLWSFTNGKPVREQPHTPRAKSPLSDMVSAALKKRGFKYCGSITVYSHLQACGIINDHSEDCFRFGELTAEYPPEQI